MYSTNSDSTNLAAESNLCIEYYFSIVLGLEFRTQKYTFANLVHNILGHNESDVSPPLSLPHLHLPSQLSPLSHCVCAPVYLCMRACVSDANEVSMVCIFKSVRHAEGEKVMQCKRC